MHNITQQATHEPGHVFLNLANKPGLEQLRMFPIRLAITFETTLLSDSGMKYCT